MSFGYSVGDFITTIRLAEELRKRFVDAPSQYQAIRADVKTLSGVVVDIEDVLPHRELSQQQEQRLSGFRKSCENVLIDLKSELAKYPGLGEETKGKCESLRDAWKRLRWDQKEIKDFRDRISLNISGLNTFLHYLTSDATFEIKSGVERLNLREDEHEQREKRQKILAWLSTYDHVSQQRDVLAKRQEGTSVWLLESDEFQKWLNHPGSTLLCPGIPGAGKTVIAATIIDHLQRTFCDDLKVGIGYFYFNYQNQQQQTNAIVLGSILQQILSTQENLPACILDLFDKHENNGGTKASLTELEEALEYMAETSSRTFIVLDALDEYYASKPSELRSLLSKFNTSKRRTPLNLVVTSRPISDITSQLRGCITKEISAQQEDIEAYIEARMYEVLRGRIHKHPDLQQLVKAGVLQAIDGMFLLARLHMDSLRDQPRITDLKKALRSLPKGTSGLDETYEQALNRIEAQSRANRALAKNILMWIAHARRSLSIDEIIQALAIEPGSAALDEESFPDPEDLDSLCAGLVTVDLNSENVGFVHYTTKEFFDRRDVFPEAHETILEACTTYMSFDLFPDILWTSSWTQFPFYAYAAKYWELHAQLARNISNQTLEFLTESGKVTASHHWRGRHWPLPCDDQREIMGVHLAARYNLPSVMSDLILNGQSAEAVDGTGMTPLLHAAERNAVSTFRDLLQKFQVDPNYVNPNPTSEGGTALIVAIFYNSTEMVQLLLDDARTDPNLAEPLSDTPLMCALRYGNIEIAKMLLTCPHIRVNSNNLGSPLLCQALGTRNREIVRLIVEDHDFVFYPTRDDFWFMAMAMGTDGMKDYIYPLISKSDLNMKNDRGVTLLYEAVKLGKMDYFEWLVEHGADISVRCGRGYEEVSLAGVASKHGHMDMLKKLLAERPADANMPNAQGVTPLHLAVKGGHTDIAAFLLSTYHVDASPTDFERRTPLHMAAKLGRKDIATLLLSTYHLDPSPRDLNSRTPLHLAAYFGQIDIVALLLSQHLVDPAPRDEHLCTPLHFAADASFTDIVALLLSQDGVDPSPCDWEGCTPLDYVARRNGRLDVMKLLAIQYGADASAETKQLVQFLIDTPVKNG